MGNMDIYEAVRSVPLEAQKTKTCKKCNIEYPATLDYFSKHKREKDGLRTECKACNKAYKKENQQRYDEHNKRYWEENKEYWKQYYENNKKIILKKRKEYLLVSVEKRRLRQRKYREERKEQTNIYTRSRRSRQKGLPSHYTAKQWEMLKEYFNNACAYCGEEKPLTQEHFLPLSCGGEYTVNNIICVCSSCNSSKNNKNFYEWYPEQSFYSKARERKILKYLGYEGNVQQLKII